jgi:hypothetical protein
VDGFNPCSLWVLSMLMALVLHTGSRKKVLFIGLIFLTVTAGIYALFIAGLFSVLRLVSFMGWVQGLVAGVALIFGVVNIKDYFWYKTGVSFTISEKQKPGIFQKIRRVIASSDSIWGLAGATVVMAAGVSLVEFSCTAGFPVLWTNLLVAQNVRQRRFCGAAAALSAHLPDRRTGHLWLDGHHPQSQPVRRETGQSAQAVRRCADAGAGSRHALQPQPDERPVHIRGNFYHGFQCSRRDFDCSSLDPPPAWNLDRQRSA